MKVIYVAGPYRSPEGLRGIHKNIEAASDVAYDLWKMGAAVICPHKNTAYFDGKDCADAELWLEGDKEMLKRCDAVVMVPGWSNSFGATQEWSLAYDLGKPIFVWETQRGALYEYLKAD